MTKEESLESVVKLLRCAHCDFRADEVCTCAEVQSATARLTLLFDVVDDVSDGYLGLYQSARLKHALRGEVPS